MFDEKEISYLKSQRLARIATVSPDGQVDVAPVVFDLIEDRFLIHGHYLEKTLKYKNVQGGQTKVAIVVDDVESTQPWRPRGIKIHGVAELTTKDGRAHIEINPKEYWTWGIESPIFVDGKPVRQKRVRVE